MIEKQLTLINKLGLHARAANKLLDTTSQFSCDIKIQYNEKTVDAKSIMSLLLLAAPVGSELIFHIEGDDEQNAIIAIENLIARRFDEAE